MISNQLDPFNIISRFAFLENNNFYKQIEAFHNKSYDAY